MLNSIFKYWGNVLWKSDEAPTVLIYADNKRRDAVSSMLLAFYLKEKGYNSVVCSRLTFKSLFFLFHPEVVILTHPHSGFSPEEFTEYSKKCKFVLMHPESSGMIRGAMLDHMRGGGKEVGDVYTKHFSKVLTWGPILKNWVVEEGLYSEGKVKDVGPIRYDVYRDLDSNKSNKIITRTAGGMPSFTAINAFDNRNIFRQIFQGRGGEGVYYGKNGGYEDCIWAAAAYVRVFLDFFDVWCLEMKEKICFRPYTLERINTYSFIQERYGEVFEIDVKSPFNEWLLRRYVNVFVFSSSVIESIISGVPYISIQGILGERLEYHQPRAELPDIRGEIYDNTYMPTTNDELVELVLKAKKGNLPLKTSINESQKLRKMLWDYYGWPRKQPSSKLVADEISTLMGDGHANNLNYRIKALKSCMRTLGSIGAMTKRKLWKTMQDYHFMPWHLQEKKYAKEKFLRLEMKENH